jgi:hypothetical protein
MINKKIDIKKTSKLAEKTGTKKIEKTVGGKVISKAIADVKKVSESKKKPKEQYVVYSDHTKTYTKHTRHGKTI